MTADVRITTGNLRKSNRPARPSLGFAATLAISVVGVRLPAQNVIPFPPALAAKIQYIVVLYTENRSFDSVYGKFPNANGLANANAEQVLQTDALGRPLAYLPQPFLSDTTDPDPRFPPAASQDRFRRSISDLVARPPNDKALANRFFDADRFAALDAISGDMVHRFYT